VTTPRLSRFTVLLGALALCGASLLEAQGGGLDVTYGRWWHDSSASSLTVAASYHNHLFGPFDFGLGVFHLNDGRSTVSRTLSGGEVSLAVGRGGGGLYLVGSVGLGMRHDNGSVDAIWSAGAGFGLSLFNVVQLGVEGRYRIEDQSVRGFWRTDPGERRGFSLQARLALGLPRGRGGGRRPPPGPTFVPPSTTEISDAAHAGGVAAESADLSVQVVQTALDAMGTPYQWGGSDENGYDCSGLIQYAYAQHGILLPRVSRDQARTGTLIDKDVAALRPGDILGFSINSRGVSHVALYVGSGTFIHSASSGGVKLSSLTADDPESRWWRQRWVVARRILN
jgi:hypothetical protein